jgi:hypothetical protein
MTSLQDYALPVHKSLQQLDLVPGIPKDNKPVPDQIPQIQIQITATIEQVRRARF